MVVFAVFVRRSSVSSIFLDNVVDVRDFLTVVVADDGNGSGDFGRAKGDVVEEVEVEVGIERRLRLLRGDLRLVLSFLEFMPRFAMAM